MRGNTEYGKNKFVDNSDGTITDQATGLKWRKEDSGRGMTWKDALSYCENLDANGYSDWRLPSSKELQRIVDYSRSPKSINSAAIDPMFSITKITDEKNEVNYPFYWSATIFNQNGQAVYVSFGEAIGKMLG